jgi:hypothetical protein
MRATETASYLTSTGVCTYAQLEALAIAPVVWPLWRPIKIICCGIWISIIYIIIKMRLPIFLKKYGIYNNNWSDNRTRLGLFCG